MWRKAVVAQYNVMFWNLHVCVCVGGERERERERETKDKHEESHQDKQFQARNTSHRPPRHKKQC